MRLSQCLRAAWLWFQQQPVLPEHSTPHRTTPRHIVQPDPDFSEEIQLWQGPVECNGTKPSLHQVELFSNCSVTATEHQRTFTTRTFRCCYNQRNQSMGASKEVSGHDSLPLPSPLQSSQVERNLADFLSSHFVSVMICLSPPPYI